MRSEYVEIASDDPFLSREKERAAMSRVIQALTEADRRRTSFAELAAALDLHDRIWSIFLEDLADQNNLLPEATRAGLVSIGLWALRESMNVRMNTGAPGGLIEINTIIRDGLEERG